MAVDNRLLYLTFGSNLHPLRIEQRVGPVSFFGTVQLREWKLCFDKRGADGSAKANLRPAPGSDSVAWAAVFEIDARQLAVLDRFEGCGGGYETIRFDIPDNGRTRPALAYLTPSQWTTQLMLPFDWYLALVIAGARHQGFPAAYVEQLAAQPSIEDADAQRAAARWALLEQMQAG